MLSTGGTQVTITYDALDLIVQVSPSAPGHPLPDMGPVETCSLDLVVQGPPLVLTSGGQQDM